MDLDTVLLHPSDRLTAAEIITQYEQREAAAVDSGRFSEALLWARRAESTRTQALQILNEGTQ